MNLLSINKMCSGYGNKQVLFDVTLNVEEGNVVLLVGSNGSGKSTLLKAVCGIASVWSGKINYDGALLQSREKPSPTHSLLKRGIQYVPQKNAFLLLSAILAATVWFVLHNVMSSPFGRVLRALSEDEVYTGSLGKNVGQAKVVSFVVSGMLASIAGVLYAHYISYIDPTSFTLDESIFILSIVIIGGMRNLWGVFLAAAFLVLLPEALRFVGLPSSVAANVRQIIYGVALVVVIFGGKRNNTTANNNQRLKKQSS